MNTVDTEVQADAAAVGLLSLLPSRYPDTGFLSLREEAEVCGILLKWKITNKNKPENTTEVLKEQQLLILPLLHVSFDFDNINKVVNKGLFRV